MQLEHAAIYVNDLEGMRVFYETYFDCTANDKYVNPKTGLETYFLTFETGARLELMTRPEIVDEDKPLYQTGFTHLAFKTNSNEKVDMLTSQLKQDGFAVLSGPRTTGDGYYESVILDPENNQIEITC
ncbi:glyoxalase [Vagococcus martis]|uniref:Glyoxalase n=1 Tax=Vagococcus martis TaxID=1768210 RepID=A0A1V4DKE6_9ENTE|nr:VOC family protein [Vagococcus martis]OPF88806.1 glyoxalase [Vagococcus martis]